MLAENIQTWAEQEQHKGREEGLQEGERLGLEKTARNLISLNALTDEQIAQATGLSVEDIAKLRDEEQGDH
ncbi:hypothetical protein LRD18_10995 [Halorhodospira halochloris]|uniref:hypothetical protein n=1 Tax=Halorhodospira halochloris TaxID=1052 RepID=UPI001EE793A9|nr:hypothetical protein [Halorhodospira halochloris]MCG5531374.1 hypothetical protein [Halorhodospira halochloris]